MTHQVTQALEALREAGQAVRLSRPGDLPGDQARHCAALNRINEAIAALESTAPSAVEPLAMTDEQCDKVIRDVLNAMADEREIDPSDLNLNTRTHPSWGRALVRAGAALHSTGKPDGEVALKIQEARNEGFNEGREWQIARDLTSHAVAPVAEPVKDAAPQWPNSRDIARLEDMSPRGHLRITLDNDNDVCVEVFDFNLEQFSSVEFCTPGSGGGKSSHTRRALLEVMRAMERDNAERPDRAHARFPGDAALSREGGAA